MPRFLAQLREHADEIERLGATVVGVAAHEDFQARKLMDDGMPFTLLLDPDDEVRTLIGAAERFSAIRLLHPRGAAAYAKGLRQAKFFGLTPSQATQRPGVVVVDGDQHVTYAHIGKRLGDYPPVDDVLAELRRLAP